MTTSATGTRTWTTVCEFSRLVPERGSVALVDGVQVALVRTHDGQVHAVQQLDPYSGAHVISRGIVGSRSAIPTITSPMYKQVFDLRTGECLESAGERPIALLTWAARVVDGAVLLLPPDDVRAALPGTGRVATA